MLVSQIVSTFNALATIIKFIKLSLQTLSIKLESSYLVDRNLQMKLNLGI